MTHPFSLVAAALVLGACSPVETEAAPPPTADAAPSDGPVTMSDPPSPDARPSAVRIVEENDLIQFEWSWPAEAAAVDAIDARFRRQAMEEKTNLTDLAREEQKLSAESGRPFNRLGAKATWTRAGQSERLLSLSGEVYSYTGGAHPNTGAASLLWDRKSNEEVTLRALFGRTASLDGALREEFCRKLDAERSKRRGGVEVDGMFGECPDISSDIIVVPTDADGNGRFERLVMIASPYVAGPYAEGSYEIVLPITEDRVAAVSEAYRPSFEMMR